MQPYKISVYCNNTRFNVPFHGNVPFAVEWCKQTKDSNLKRKRNGVKTIQGRYKDITKTIQGSVQLQLSTTVVGASFQFTIISK